MAGRPLPELRRSGVPADPHCAIPRTYRRTGLAHRNNRNAGQAQRAGELVSVGPPGRRDEARWPTGGARIARPGAPPLPAEDHGTLATLVGWLSTIRRRLGDQLFAVNDAEAYWRRWQITKVHGGLGRYYRDPLFDTLRITRRTVLRKWRSDGPFWIKA